MMMPAWLSVPVYLGVIFLLLCAGEKATSLWHTWRLLAKANHAEKLNREELKKRMHVVPREPSRRRAASP